MPLQLKEHFYNVIHTCFVIYEAPAFIVWSCMLKMKKQEETKEYAADMHMLG